MTSKSDTATINSLKNGMGRLEKDITRKERELGAERMKNDAYQKAAFDHVATTTHLEQRIGLLEAELHLKIALLETRDLQFAAQDNQIKGMIDMARIYASGGKPI